MQSQNQFSLRYPARLLAALLAILFWPSLALCLSDLELDAMQAGFAARRNQALQQQVNSPYPGYDPDPSADNAWHWLDFALSAMYMNQKLPQANDAVTSCVQYFENLAATQPGAFFGLDGNFHWRAPQLLRIYEFFYSGSNWPGFAGRLSPANEAAIRELIWKVVDREAYLENTETTTTRASKTWRLAGSENHDIMEDTGIWWSSMILKRDPAYRDRVCDDGGTVLDYYNGYTAYYREYLIERARRGLFVEIDSINYEKYTLQCLHNMFDFAEDTTQRFRAGKLLDLYWAVWATNQIDAVGGGSKARTYQTAQYLRGALGGVYNLSWNYSGILGTMSVHPGILCAVTSEYRLPRVVLDLLLDTPGRGVYESRQRAMGLCVPGFTSPPDYRLDTDNGGILRYTYATPDFMMGSSLMQARPYTEWAAISAQNRWNGVIFAGNPDARIAPQCKSTEAGADYSRTVNAYWATQRKGTMIAQKLNSTRHAGATRVWVAGPNSGLTSRTEDSGWVFVVAPQAYAAVRPVGGGYTWVNSDPAIEPGAPDGQWYQASSSSFYMHPILIEAARKSDYASFDAFKTDVKDNPLSYNGTSKTLTYTSIYGDSFVFYGDQTQMPLINGAADNLTPPKTYDSPFVQGDWESSVITVQKGARSVVIDFNDIPATSSVTAPFDGWLYVNRLENGLVGDGHSFATGLPTIQQAIDAWTPAVKGIRVASGVYGESFALKTGIRIFGGYDPQGAFLDSVAFPSILMSDTFHVARAEDASDWLLDGLTILGGAAVASSGADSTGGGLYAMGSAGTLRNVVFTGNMARGGGAVALDGDTSITFRECHFLGNASTSAGGGAVQLFGASNALFEQCVFTSNTTSNQGGVIQIKGADAQARFQRCAFFHNGGNPTINTYGGVAEASTGTLAFTNCIFAFNRAGRGPVASVSAPHFDMVHCTLYGNYSENAVATPQGILRLIAPTSGTYRVINNIFENNPGSYALKNWGSTWGFLVHNNLFHPDGAGSVYAETMDLAALNKQAWASNNVLGPANLRMLGSDKRSGTWTTVTANAPALGSAMLEDASAAFALGSLAGSLLAPRGNLEDPCLLVLANGAKSLIVRGAQTVNPGDAYLLVDLNPLRPSPAIDTATTQPGDLIPAIDYLGAPRQYPLSKPDIGAYELASPETTSAQPNWALY